MALETSLEEIGHVGFTGHDGSPTTVNRALRATLTERLLLVLRRGRIAMEWYGPGMSATAPHIIFSVGKSICGALGGILADRGLLDPDDRVVDYIPELASSVYAGCTIRHLLDMAVGITFGEDYDDPATSCVPAIAAVDTIFTQQAGTIDFTAQPTKARRNQARRAVSLCLDQYRRAGLGL